MSPENQRIILEKGRQVADSLRGKLLPKPDRPIRNPHAHVWKTINSTFDVESYKDIPDDRFDHVMAMLETIMKIA